MIRQFKNKHLTVIQSSLAFLILISVPFWAAPPATAAPSAPSTYVAAATYKDNVSSSTHHCGSGSGAITTSINFGCKGEHCGQQGSDAAYCSGNNSAILDLAFALIRFLSYGVGFVVVASLVIAGIQYTISQGDPKATAAAETRIRSTIIALIIYIFGYAILNYIIPHGFLK